MITHTHVAHIGQFGQLRPELNPCSQGYNKIALVLAGFFGGAGGEMLPQNRSNFFVGPKRLSLLDRFRVVRYPRAAGIVSPTPSSAAVVPLSDDGAGMRSHGPQETCSQASADFEERKKARTGEIQAVSEAIEILTSDEAKDAASGTFGFVQAGFQRHASQDRRRAAEVLRSIARRTHNPTLSILATSVELDAFAKVKKASCGVVWRIDSNSHRPCLGLRAADVKGETSSSPAKLRVLAKFAEIWPTSG